MIGFFPEFYEDELMYSLLARYYVRTGYYRYTFAADDLFENKLERPKIEFLNGFSGDLINYMIKDHSMAEIVEKHTMYPFYNRFVPLGKRQKGFNALVALSGFSADMVNVPTMLKDERRFLRYCPRCAEEDRALHGETFWHRSHQIIGVDVCPKHFCRLVKTQVLISAHATPVFSPAESAADEISAEGAVSTRECEVAEYVNVVFQSPLDLKKELPIGRFFHERMAYTKYRSTRGEMRNLSLLTCDFLEYYKDLPSNTIKEYWQLTKTLSGHRFNAFEICLIGNFLNITPQELCNASMQGVNQEKEYDDAIVALHAQGLNYRRIQERLGGSYDYIKAIGEGRKGKS